MGGRDGKERMARTEQTDCNKHEVVVYDDDDDDYDDDDDDENNVVPLPFRLGLKVVGLKTESSPWREESLSPAPKGESEPPHNSIHCDSRLGQPGCSRPKNFLVISCSPPGVAAPDMPEERASSAAGALRGRNDGNHPARCKAARPRAGTCNLSVRVRCVPRDTFRRRYRPDQ